MENTELLYDGECPVCSAYAKHACVAVKTDARTSSTLREEATKARLDLDEGFILKKDGVLYHGWEAMHLLARDPGKTPLALRLFYLPMRSRSLARTLYPVLARARMLLLKIMGKEPIGNLEP